MNFSKLTVRLNLFIALSILIISYFLTSHNIKNANASSNPSGISNKYGCMISRSMSGFSTLYSNANNVGMNAMVYLDYSSNSFVAVIGNVSGFNSSSPTENSTTKVGTFVETVISNTNNVAYSVQLTDSSNNQQSLRFITMPVNSGATILMTEVEESATSAPWNGVCQKI